MPLEPLVHLIDDDDAVRDSLSFLLETAGIACRTYETARLFLEADLLSQTGCVVTDVRMPDMTGIDLLRRLAEGGGGIPVIVITGHGDIPLAVEAMRLGAVDFIEKPFDDEVLLDSVRAALARGYDRHGHAAERSAVRARIESLSPRERDVLHGLVAGHPNKTIAFDLGISPRTVEVYRANVMSKMQASSLSDLVRMALMDSSFSAPAAGR